MLEVPRISFGTYKLKGAECYDATLAALEAGYTSIDTARCYGNEKEVGEAIASFLALHPQQASRAALFITSKIAPAEMVSEETAYNAVLSSLSLLRTDYLDLYLIHWPGKAKTALSDHEANSLARHDVWRALMRCKREGLVRHIGVSNFNVSHLEEMLAIPDLEPPSVNQVEIHPLYRQTDLREYCAAHSITIQAYSSLGSSVPDAHVRLLEHPAVLAIASEALMMPAQVCLIWAVKQGLPIIPKSASPARIRENLATARNEGKALHLSDQQMALLGGLQERKLCWDSKDVL